MKRKISLFLAVLMLMISMPWNLAMAAEVVYDNHETFDNFASSSNSYDTHNITGVNNGPNWVATGARRAEIAQQIEGRGVTLGNRTLDNSSISTIASKGVGIISVDLKKAYTNSEHREMALFIDDVRVDKVTVPQDGTIVQLSATVNKSGNVSILIKPLETTNNRAHVTVDNIKWTNYESTENPDTEYSVNFELDPGLTSTDLLLATVKNGEKLASLPAITPEADYAHEGWKSNVNFAGKTAGTLLTEEELLNNPITQNITFTAVSKSTKPVQVSTIAEARGISGEVTTKGFVTFFDANDVVIEDLTAGINLFRRSDIEGAIGGTVALGDEIQVTGMRSAFNGLEQIGSLSTIQRLSTGNTLPVQEVSLATVLASSEDYESERIQIKNVTIETINTNGNTEILSDGQSLSMFRIPALTGINAGDKVDVTGVFSQFNTYQLRVALPADVVLVEEGGSTTVPPIPKTDREDPITDAMAKDHNALTIPEVLALPDQTETTVIGVATYSYGGGSSLIIQDIIDGEIVGYQIYGPTENVEPGDIVVVSGKHILYYDMPELSNLTEMKVVGKTTPFEPQVVTVDQIKAYWKEVENEYIRVNDIKLPAYTDGQANFNAVDGKTLQTYRMPVYPIGTVTGDVVDIVGAGSSHRSNFQIRLNSTQDYILKNDNLASFIIVSDYLDARSGMDYTFTVEVIDNVKVVEAGFTATIGTSDYKGVLSQDPITGIWKGTIPGDRIVGANEMKLEFSATDSSNNISNLVYNAPFQYGVTNPRTEDVIIKIDNRPVVSSVSPAMNAETRDDKRPVITVGTVNAGTNPVVQLILNGQSYDMSYENGVASYTPTIDLKDGKVNATVKILRSEDKVESEDYNWSFYIGESNFKHYYGQIHSHTNYSDGAGTLIDAMEYAKNADQIDFFAITDHSNYFDKADNLGILNESATGIMDSNFPNKHKWEVYKETISRYKTDDFLPIYGYEMTWTKSGANYGHINTYNTVGFVSRNDPYYNNKNNSEGLIAYYEELTRVKSNSFSQFNHPGSTFGTFDDFAHYNPRYDREIQLVEVGNGEGAIGSNGYWRSYQYYTMALDKGWHVAPSNNQDNHKGKWGDSNDARNVAIADSLTYESIADAVDNHRFYSTEDKNLKIDYTLNGEIMGSKLENAGSNLDIKVEIVDPDVNDVIGKVELISNGGKVLGTNSINSNTGTVEFKVPNEGTYYYIKITQSDGDIAVTAPVWTAKIEIVDIDSITKNTEIEEVGKPTKINTTFNNESDNSITIQKVEYISGNEVLKTVTDELPTLSNKVKTSFSTDVIPTIEGKQKLTVKITDTKGITYAKDIELNVYPADMKVSTILEVQQANEGKLFTIEGRLTSNASGYDKNTAFFDSAYIQDETGGINIFPISSNLQEGAYVRIKGQTSSYQGEHQLNVDSIETIDSSIEKVVPKDIKTGIVKDNLGLLVKTTGKVKSVVDTNGIIDSIIVDDGTGEIRIFIDGYIGKSMSEDKSMENIKVGDTISAIGLSSIDPEGNRIRIRNREDVKVVNDSPVIEKDKIKPVILGVNREQYYNEGDFIDLLKGVSATDNVDGKVEVIVVPGSIDSSKPGIYKVVYIAVDKSGNKAEVESTVVVLAKSKPEEPNPVRPNENIHFDNGLTADWTFSTPSTTTQTAVIPTIPAPPLSSPWENPFIDVSSVDWYYGDVQYIHQNSLMQGTEINTFSPNMAIQRSMFVEIIYRMRGKPENINSSIKFKDVPLDAYFADAVIWANSNGIVEGIEDDKFDPYSSLTREQLVTILYRYAKYNGMETSSGENLSKFYDSEKISSWSVEAMNWAIQKGIINGMEDGSLAPQGTATRAQVAAIISRFHKMSN